jgi:DNA modification methylase
VLHFATECSNKGHSAAFPKDLPAWFIKLFTKSGDWVLDPFAGSGTTCIAAQEAGRNSIGIELFAEYCEIAEQAVGDDFGRIFGGTGDIRVLNGIWRI